MNIEEARPMDKVIWHRVKKGTAYDAERIPAEIWYRTKFKIAIKFTDHRGQEFRKYVSPEQLTRVRDQ